MYGLHEIIKKITFINGNIVYAKLRGDNVKELFAAFPKIIDQLETESFILVPPDMSLSFMKEN